jgi:hypothetical protein
MKLIFFLVKKIQDQIKLLESQVELLLHHPAFRNKEQIRHKQPKQLKSKIHRSQDKCHLTRQTVSYQNPLMMNGILNHQDPLQQREGDVFISIISF